MALVRTLSKGLRKTPRQGGNPGDVDGPTVTISGYPTDPTDDPTPTFTFSANESGCTFEYKINAGSYAACTSPLTLDAQTDGTYTIYIRATDSQGNVGAAATYSWDLATAYAGSLPSTVAELNGWSLASPWTLLYNFDAATLGPAACAAATGSVGNNLQKLGSASDSAKTADGQSGYADQSGYTVNSDQDFLYANATTNWSFSATVPTCYLLTFKFVSTPTTYYTIFAGQDGSAGGGWSLGVHQTSGIRAMIGNGTSGFVATSYVGGTNFFDGEYHTVLLVIDDAAGKAKIYSEFGNTESTGLTIGGGASFCTIGPSGAGLGWSAPVTYLVAARGQHPLLYTNAQSLFDEYEDARLNNINQTAIAGLPTAISDLNSVTGLTFTNGWNLGSASSNAPLTGASGPTLVPDTGALRGGGTGTQPTLAVAPQIRTSFTSQAAVLFDSADDNLGVTGALPTSDFTMLVIWQAPASHTSGAGIVGKVPSVAGDAGWELYALSGNTRLSTYNSFSTYSDAVVAVATNSGSLWHVIMVKCATAGLTSRLVVNTTAANSAALGAFGSNTSQKGNIGSHYNDVELNGKMAFCAWLSGQTTDGNITTAIANFRWRYGI